MPMKTAAHPRPATVEISAYCVSCDGRIHATPKYHHEIGGLIVGMHPWHHTATGREECE